MRTTPWEPTTCGSCGGPARRAKYVSKKVDDYKTYCPKCQAEYNKNNPRKRKKRTSDENRESNQRRKENGQRRSWYIKKKYGLTQEDAERLVSEQGGTCAICPTPVTWKSHIDHNHKTGKVRGILCARCNPALGRMLDDPARLRRAADYLEKHGS